MGTTLDYLVQELHDAQKTEDEERIIAVELKLAEFHYNNSNFLKAQIFLKSILRKKKGLENIHYYLGLIDINQNKFDEAIKNLDLELKYNPNNIQAKKVREKLIVKSNFPMISAFLVIVNILFFIFNFPEISLINSIKFGVSNFNLSFFSTITSMFFHINLFHFLVNILILILFGPILEKDVGSINFFIIYLFAGLFGNFIQALFSAGSIVLGASGALFGLLGALMMREPLFKVRLFGIFQIPIIFLLGIFFSISFIGEILFTSNLISGDLSHMIGIFVGIFIAGILYRERISVFYNWLFIVGGFWLIAYSINSIINFGFNFDLEFGLNLILILVSFLVIVYSYVHLKTLEGFRQ